MNTQRNVHVEFKFLGIDREPLLTLIVKDYRDFTARIVDCLANETGAKEIELVYPEKPKEE